MPLKQSLMIKGSNNTAVSSLSLSAKAGESLRIKGLKFGALTTKGYVELFIDRVSVGFYYAGDINANHLEQYDVTTLLGNVFDRLVALGIHTGYPVGEGQTFEVKPAVAGSTVVGQIIYEIGEKDDFKPTDPNGSSSKVFCFLNYGTNTAQFLATAYGNLDLPRNPTEYPAFPFGATVPPKQKVEILGALLQCWKDNEGSLGPSYGFLRLMKDRVTLWDEDRRGMFVGEGMGLLTWGPCRQTNVDIRLFPEPLVFGPGDELLVQLSAVDKTVVASGVNFALIERITVTE